MKTQYIDFIGMYQNPYPDGFCNHMISEFERVRSNGYCGKATEQKSARWENIKWERN